MISLLLNCLVNLTLYKNSGLPYLKCAIHQCMPVGYAKKHLVVLLENQLPFSSYKFWLPDTTLLC
jgi:hypothetical protein